MKILFFCVMITLQIQLSFSSLTYYPSAGYSGDVSGASASSELNVRNESQGGSYASQAVRSYLRFSDWFSVWVTHESMLRLNLYVPKLCTEEMCSTCVFILMLQFHV